MDIIGGQIVRSKAGRDKGELFLVIKVELPYLYLVNGELRKVDRPKKKKLKHVQATAYVSEFIKNRLDTVGKVTNHEVREALSDYVESKREEVFCG